MKTARDIMYEKEIERLERLLEIWMNDATESRKLYREAMLKLLNSHN